MKRKTEIAVFGCTTQEMALIPDDLPVCIRICTTPLTMETLYRAENCRCVSINHAQPISAALLDRLAAQGVQYLSTRSVGTDHIDLFHAAKIGMCVEHVRYSPGSVAEYTLLLLLMLLRHSKMQLLKTEKQDFTLPLQSGRELGDLTVGVVGTGAIGSSVVQLLRGFGCTILTCDTQHKDSRNVPLETLLAEADAVTLHVPLTAETMHLLNAGTFSRMKPGALLVNTARGGLVDSAALLAALQCGKLGGAALDVLEQEETLVYRNLCGQSLSQDMQVQQAILAMPNVIYSPHVAFYTEHAVTDMVMQSLGNCIRFLRNQKQTGRKEEVICVKSM